MSFSRLLQKCTYSTKNSVFNTTRNIFNQQSRSIQIMTLNTPKESFEAIRQRSPHQKEFLQAVEEVIDSLAPLFEQHPHYRYVLPVIAEPERVIQFRVPWTSDKGVTHINRGFRVQFNQALGPYKGGLRFHPSVNSSIIKFLGFEQIFKNALTTLPLGGGKGGSDFNPKGKSEAEILRFCQSFMTELSQYIGPEVDVPAGDIGVGGREIGYLFGQYKRINMKHDGVLTGKGAKWGGSLIRPEATGYGLCYLTETTLKNNYNDSIKGKRVAISGSGNVAEYCAEKVIELGGTVMSLSDSNGTIIEPNGFTEQQVNIVREIKRNRGRVSDYLQHSKTAKFLENTTPWQNVDCDIAFPCATQNEINSEDANYLVNNGCMVIGEGSNMSSTNNAVHVYNKARKNPVKKYFCYLPAKAANAGGVAVSGLEMCQNSQKLSWTREEVDNYLKKIMTQIHYDITEEAEQLGDKFNYQLGANSCGFRRVSDSMFEQGMLIINNEETLKKQDDKKL